ncbi:MAG: RNA polymerase sigma factor [candidate division Zixibacteria bacterium]|nr:RNA polymerase sigma factor [candidate division Zixibacteria bacterium]
MDRDLFWTYLETEHPRAEAFCRKLAKSRDEGDDVYQDALLMAMRRVRTLRDPAAFRPWLYRIIVNTYRNRVVGPWWRRRAPLTRELCETQAGADPSEAYAARRWLDRALDVLKPEERALVTLFELEGWSIAELAELQNRPQGTIKARLVRARKKMREAIAGYLPAETSQQESKESGATYALPQSEQSPE